MNWFPHYNLTGQHSFLSPSKHHWVNYDDEKLRATFLAANAAKRGITLHNFAKQCIDLGVKLPKSRASLNQFVNDAIGYRMEPEQILFYSHNSFGTADAISFRNNILRIHDLKTGRGRVYIDQLEIYAALFCLEYVHDPKTIDIELRIYQTSKIVVDEVQHTRIKRIMEKIIRFDKKLNEFKEEILWIR